MKKALLYATSALSALGPMVAFAAVELSDLETTVQNLTDLVELLVPFVIGLALLFFLWGLAKFILAAGDEDAKETGKRIMIWGIVAFVVMLSVWGIVELIQSSLGIEDGAAPDAPEIPA